MRNRFIINDLAPNDGGLLLRHVRLLVIGLGHDHSLMLTSISGSRWLALVLVMVIHCGQERRRTFHHWTKALLPRAPWHQ